MKMNSLFEQGGALPDGYSLETITFGTALATIDSNALSDKIKDL